MAKKIYFDYAAGTPVDSRVFSVMRLYFMEKFGNAGSLHTFGQEAMAVVDFARENIAKHLNADFREIIFTGSATEANNLAIKGVVQNFVKENPGVKPKIILSEIEHDSVFKTCEVLKNLVDVEYLPTGKDGVVKIKNLKEKIDNRTAIISVMFINNETGVIQPIKKVSEIISDYKKENNSLLAVPKLYAKDWPIFHSDCVQASQFFDCTLEKTGADLMTFSAHKIYGPKGIGCLFVKKGIKLQSIINGGEQEYGLRSGTENVPLIVGFSKAVELLKNQEEKNNESERMDFLTEKFLGGIKKIFPKAELNFENSARAPHILSIYFSGIKSEVLLTKLDLNGIAASAGSACSARSLSDSRVLKACGFSSEKLKSTVRFSFGRMTTKEEIDESLKIFKTSSKF